MARFPSPGTAWPAIRSRARGVRYFAQDLAYAAGRVPRAAGRAADAFWGGLGTQARRRLVAALGCAAVVLVIVVAVAPVLPCSLPGGDECAPTDDAAELVPGDALAYAHLSLDPDTAQAEQLAELGDELPLLRGQVGERLLAQVPGPNGRPPSYREDIEPWFGGEAALALLPARRSARTSEGTPLIADEVELLEVADEQAAERYRDSIYGGGGRGADYRGTEMTVAGGLTTALAGGFLLIGTERAVKSLIDVATGADGAPSLAADADAERARERLPEERVADVYISANGAAELLAGERAPFASLEPFVDAGATTGAAAAIVAQSDGLALEVRSALDPERARADPGFFAAFPGFDPSLDGTLAPDTLAYLGFGDPGTTVKRLLEQASAQAPGVAAGFRDLADRLLELGKVDLAADLLPSLGDEAALALQPGPREVPFAQFLATGVDAGQAREALAGLQAPIAEALAGPAQQAPVFQRRELAGQEAEILRISPAVGLSYAVFDSLIVVATDPTGVEQVAAGEGGLASGEAFADATEGLARSPSMLVYLDLAGLLHLAELNGLGESPAYATFAQELRRLEALGMSVVASNGALDTDLRLVIGPAPAPGEGGGADVPAPPG